jgi:hypothetical protein
LLDAVMDLEREVTNIPAGDPRLADVGARIDAIEKEVGAQRGMSEPLVPDASQPTSPTEATLENLDRALRSLRSAVASKR